MLSRAYTIASLSVLKVIGIHTRILINGAGLPLQKANRILCIYNNRYRYHKNTMINKGLLSLVGIADCFAARACPSQCRNNVTSL